MSATFHRRLSIATILIVDDRPDTRKFLTTLLQHQGHRLLEASDGGEGLAAVRAELPDLVITDVLMPVMDGYELVRQLRLDPATSAIPVVFYTAHYGAHDARALARSGGVSDVLTKPAESAEVLKIVGRALSGESKRGRPPDTDPLTTEFDREHLRLVTGKLSEKAVDLRTANAQLRALLAEREHEILERQQVELALRRERDRAQQSVEALRLADERTKFALKAAGVGIWDMDYTTGVHQWSETLEAQYGLQPGTFGGTFEAFVERVHPDDRASVLETVGRAVKAGSDFSVQHRTIWSDGTVRWLSGAGRVLLGGHGEPVRAVGISLDVTERRTLEDQYQQAQKMEAVGRLAGGVAHDFNNLLTAIMGYCELLLADLDPHDRHYEDITEIHKAGACAAGLTRQLLAFSRKQIIEPTLLDLSAVVADLRVMLGRLIGEDVKIELRLGAEPASVKADRGQVDQIVMNLAVNARDAMPEGGTLTIETANVELDEHYAKTHLAVTPGPYVVLTVSDTGTGMTPQVQARLFEPFFTTKEVGKGTGLGLATVHGIVLRNGGSINVYSEVGRGTSFKVYFPRADAAGAIAAPPPAARPRAVTQTVLVVEDADGLRELAKRLLQRQGYTVLAASNADDAIRLFEQHASIDVLLTDVVMPGTSGPELTRRLVERRPSLKVIYMSGYTEEAIVQHGVLQPGVAFLHKPFTSDTLGRKIREVLDR